MLAITTINKIVNINVNVVNASNVMVIMVKVIEKHV